MQEPKSRLAGMSFTVPLVSVIAALADFVVSAAAIALRVTVALVGTVAGAVYVLPAPLAVFAELTVPHPGEQLVPLCVIVQFAPALLASLLTVAVKSCVALMGIIPLGGETDTVTAGTVTFAVNDLVVSVTEVAVMLTAKSLAGGAGAVYVVAAPLAVDVGETPPQGAGEQDTVHVTPASAKSLPTVALNCAVDVARTVAVGG